MESSNEDEAEILESSIAPDSIPSGAMHWAEREKKKSILALELFVPKRETGRRSVFGNAGAFRAQENSQSHGV